MIENYIKGYEIEYQMGWELETIVLINDFDETKELINNILKEYIYDCKFERMNLSFFKRSYKSCTLKQLNYFTLILKKNFEYELSSVQYNFLKKLSISEVSKLINMFSNFTYEYKEPITHKTVCLSKVEGSYIYNKNKSEFYQRVR